MSGKVELPRYFYLLMEKLLGRYFQVWSPYYENGKHLFMYYQKTPIYVSWRWHVCLYKPISTDLNIQVKC